MRNLLDRVLSMKKIFLTIFLIAFLSCFSQNRFPKFILAFGNDFNGDSVSIIINQIQVAKNIKLKPTVIDPQNLMIEQNNSALVVESHNQRKIKFNRIQIKDSILNLRVGMNNIWQTFNLDLRKGHALIAKYSYFKIGWSVKKFITIRQTDAILML